MSRCESRFEGNQCAKEIQHDVHEVVIAGGFYRSWTDAEADAPPAPRMTPLCGVVSYNNGDPDDGSHPCALLQGHTGRHECEGACCWWTYTAPARDQPCAPGCEHERAYAGLLSSERIMACKFHSAQKRIAELEATHAGAKEVRAHISDRRAALDCCAIFLANLASTSADVLSVQTQRDLLQVLNEAQKALGKGNA